MSSVLSSQNKFQYFKYFKVSKYLPNLKVKMFSFTKFWQAEKQLSSETKY